MVEDRMLAAWVAHIDTSGALYSRLSLHHDGLRINEAVALSLGGDSIPAFCASSAKAIERETGFPVDIVQKKHYSFLERLSRREPGRSPSPVPDPLLLKGGNCIPLALWRLRATLGAAADALWSADFLSAEVAMSSGLRQYRECFAKGKLRCDQHLGFDPRAAGAYLLHCESRGSPHCVAVLVSEPMLNATVYDGEFAWVIPLPELRAMVSSAIDWRVTVSFHVWDSAASPPPLPTIAERIASGMR